MPRFLCGHATHPQWDMAAALVLAQLVAQLSQPGEGRAPRLGLVYITEPYVDRAQALLDVLAAALPQVTDWAGTVGAGVLADEAVYQDEPALAVMLCPLPAHQYRVFSGVAPLGTDFAAHTALVHADPRTPDLAELVDELAARTASGRLFGGLAASRSTPVQFAAGEQRHTGHGVYSGGLSGVLFGDAVRVVTRVSQGCVPVAPPHRVTAAEHNLLLALDDEPALDVLLRDLEVSLAGPVDAHHPVLTVLRHTLVGLGETGQDVVAPSGTIGAEVTVRHLIGLDPARRAVALADRPTVGMPLVFCRRDATAARADLSRLCAGIRDAWAGPADAERPPTARIAAALYVCCAGRAGDGVEGAGVDLPLIRQALGDVPLIGFLAGGEVAGRRLHAYAGVLTVFAAAPSQVA